MYSQSLYTTFSQIGLKLEDATELVRSYRDRLQQTSLFTSAGGELKCLLRERLTDQQIGMLTNVFSDLAEDVKKLGSTESKME